jgi:nucleoid-associated protein YgaU
MTPAGGALGRTVGGFVQGARGSIAASKAGAAKALSIVLPGAEGLTAEIPLLRFIWGPPEVGFWYAVKLESVSVNYVRMDRLGMPTRAEVNLNMQIQPSKLGTLPTNPTSGGLPGRASYTVTEGDNLQAIALAGYGSPGRWRALAEANDIDDPMRVRPGHVVYLPNRDELTDGRG